MILPFTGPIHRQTGPAAHERQRGADHRPFPGGPDEPKGKLFPFGGQSLFDEAKKQAKSAAGGDANRKSMRVCITGRFAVGDAAPWATVIICETNWTHPHRRSIAEGAAAILGMTK